MQIALIRPTACALASADFPGYHSPDRALVGDEERTAHAMAQKRLNEAKAKPTR